MMKTARSIALLSTLSALACDQPEAVCPGVAELPLVIDRGEVTPRDNSPTSAWVMKSWYGEKIRADQFAEIVMVASEAGDPQWPSCTLSYYTMNAATGEQAVGLGCSTRAPASFRDALLVAFNKNAAVQVLP